MRKLSKLTDYDFHNQGVNLCILIITLLLFNTNKLNQIRNDQNNSVRKLGNLLNVAKNRVQTPRIKCVTKVVHSLTT